ncbi:hypothetical protein HMPREF9248_0817 [Fannyhessea vaginae PB189-T1-4]|uniref:THUMP domain-containing protein n=1 Tax=Fannyhessea vaginae PB189-T1-4 TaxID=866774 RepID=A0ABN0B049_9ACTN|nr:class I SAM-dependent methyltransferase [Fannyhessea vaginae]EFL44034.1 hypothetical protein HMPREF9248_0817 [Fannyhessea vaginae PB189-T1-4]
MLYESMQSSMLPRDNEQTNKASAARDALADASTSTATAEQCYEFFATCPRGFEQLLARELASLQLDRIRPLSGRVSFFGTVFDGYRACLCSRIASRIICVIARVDASCAEELYQHVCAIRWEDHITQYTRIAVSAHGTNTKLTNTQFVALKTKDAIVDTCLTHTGWRPEIDVHAPNLTIDVHLSQNRATVGIDFSGTALCIRGYERKLAAPRPQAAGKSGVRGGLSGRGFLAANPFDKHKSAASSPSLRSDYACALLSYARWFAACRHPHPTLVVLSTSHKELIVEAVAQALGVAPGKQRMHWGFEGWKQHNAQSWKRALAQSETHERAQQEQVECVHVQVLTIDAAHTMRTDALIAALRSYGVNPDYVDIRSAPLDAGAQPAKANVQKTAAAGAGTGTRTDGAAADEQEPCYIADVTAAHVHNDAACCQALVQLRSFIAYVDVQTQTQPQEELQEQLKTQAAAVVYAPADLLALLRETHYPMQQAPLLTQKGRDSMTCAQLKGNAHTQAQVVLAGDFTNGEKRSYSVLDEGAQQFADRLKKMYKQRRAAAQAQDVSCYRIYDCDLPDFALSIDMYAEDADYVREFGRAYHEPAQFLMIDEYAAPREIDAHKAKRRLYDAIQLASLICNVPYARIYVHKRTRAKGGSQYSEQAQSTKFVPKPRIDSRDDCDERRVLTRIPAGSHLIDESGLCFEVNFTERHDCGIFLDLRDIRSEIREMAKQTHGSKRFLNLFAYTGTSTCYAADGGAKFTTTVDMSAPSLAWAQRNMARNGFTGSEHEFVQADVLEWVQDMRHSANRWDLILCDVPTFSNSSRMKRSSWDVQRDHAELIITLSRLLTKNGKAIFSCNLRTFTLDADTLAKARVHVEPLGSASVPFDFARSKHVHRAFIITREQSA